MKLAIVGSRNWPYPMMIHAWMLSQIQFATEIVSGGAKGVDTFAMQFASDFNIPFKEFPADWERLGKQAGFVRNAEIVKYADRVVAFSLGDSPGTKHTIGLARRAGKLQEVIQLEQIEVEMPIISDLVVVGL